ncbi:hypothetical protein DV704_05960 [Meiothermus sp. QL-1]|uniref:hypothetical protein n=1 Tax=Meiothermus sp. QL-1 TaxID=2058095 RepID=UPI000E0BED9F|nr:hypothetical protein [Meiothermus sp. QL-1]RDI95814.1 hypothetical protein DV704_05960 [Meiothermus sp. QL-1]
MRWLFLLLAGCAPVFLGADTLPVSQRYGLVLPEAKLIARLEEGPVEITEFYFEPQSGYRPRSVAEIRRLGELLQGQLQARGFVFRCERYNLLLGEAYWVLRMQRGSEGVGLYLRALERPDAYRLEVALTAPQPPLFQCPPR